MDEQAMKDALARITDPKNGAPDTVFDLEIVRSAPEKWPELTAREVQVAVMLAQGLTCKEIAAVLTISTKTADTHRMNILRKLGVDNTVKLCLIAVKRGAVSCG